MCVCVLGVCYCLHVEVKSQLAGITSPLPPWGSGIKLSLSGLATNAFTHSQNHLTALNKEIFFSFFFLVQTASYYLALAGLQLYDVDQTNLKLTVIYLPLLPGCLDWKHMPPWLATKLIAVEYSMPLPNLCNPLSLHPINVDLLWLLP